MELADAPRFNPTDARRLARDNERWSGRLQRLPDEWLRTHPAWQSVRHRPVAVWRSKHHLVTVYREAPGVRLTVNRTVVDPRTGTWADGITWDDLQRLKAEVGLGACWAMELFPPDGHVINVAPLRHLWVLPVGTEPDYGWRVEPRVEP